MSTARAGISKTSRGRARSPGAAGFTLIELMVVVAVVGILAAIAYPSYADYVRRGQLQEAFTFLADYRAKMEQYYLDNRNYGDEDGCAPVAAASWNSFAPAGAQYFTFGCATGNSGQSYTLTATGAKARAGGHTYTITDTNTKKTTAFKGQTVSKDCWLIRGDEC